jgi:nucleoside-diphosphate-sugar epimerase
MTDWSSLHGQAFQGDRVLVTGGAGFIGAHLTRALLELGAKVVVLDNLSGADASSMTALGNQFGSALVFVQGSVLDQTLVAHCVNGCRFVFHEAALGSVPRSVAEPVLFFENNVTGTANVLEASRAAKVERLMFAASSSAYGDSVALPKIETMPIAPRSPYAAGKVAGEALLAAYATSLGLDTVSLRYFNIFGPNQNANSAYAAVIAAFAKALLAGKRPVIYGDGEQSRDFTYVDNAVHANLLAARANPALNGQVINVAIGTRVSVNELAKLMAKAFGRPELSAVHEPERAGDVKHSLADLGVARQVLGYEPIVGFEDGLKRTCDWYGAARESGK